MKQAVMEQRSRLTQIEAPSGMNDDQKVILKQAINESFIAGFRWVMLVSAGLAVLSAMSAWLMIDGKARATSQAKPESKIA